MLLRTEWMAAPDWRPSGCYSPVWFPGNSSAVVMHCVDSGVASSEALSDCSLCVRLENNNSCRLQEKCWKQC